MILFKTIITGVRRNNIVIANIVIGFLDPRGGSLSLTHVVVLLLLLVDFFVSQPPVLIETS